MRDAGELKWIVEAVEHPGAVVHAAGEGAGLDALIACGRARREIAAHAGSEDAYSICVDLRYRIQIVDDRRCRALELDHQSALKPALALSRSIEGEGRHAAAEKGVFHRARFFFGRLQARDDHHYRRLSAS